MNITRTKRFALAVIAAPAILLACGLALFFAPSKLDVRAWTPPENAYPLISPDTAELFAGLHVWGFGSGSGPEDAAWVDNQWVYTGLADGRIVRFRPADQAAAYEVVANTGGRPLGLESAPNGDIYIADARRGLLRLDREGDLHVLVANRPAGPLLFADDVAVTADGVVWFTEASSRRGIEQSLLEFVERHPSGRLWRYAPETGSLTLVADQLGFANGVTVSFDGAALLFAQTSLLRISRYWLSGPKSGEIETFADGLPGYPDNIRADANGRYWIGMVAPRNYADERNGRAPLLRLAIWRLGTLLPQPSARPPVGWVIALDGHGRVVANLRSPRDALVSITSATPTPYGLMLGANRGGAMAAIDPPSYQEDPPID